MVSYCRVYTLLFASIVLIAILSTTVLRVPNECVNNPLNVNDKTRLVIKTGNERIDGLGDFIKVIAFGVAMAIAIDADIVSTHGYESNAFIGTAQQM